MPYALTWLPQVLLSAGLKVSEVPGWTDHGRREMGPIAGIVCHHTAGPLKGNMPSLNVLLNGRPDLPGPLSQLGLGRDGTFYVVAAGSSNHAGPGSWCGVSGNSRFIGIEAENTGLPNDPWPDVQMDAYRRGVAAMLKHLGLPVEACCGHKEYAPNRKVDPSFDMNLFRAGVSAILNGTGPVRPLIPAADSQNRPTLRRGDRGDAVARAQAAVGVVPADGLFGPLTESSIRKFQAAKGLVPDGIVGPRTWEAIEATLSSNQV